MHSKSHTHHRCSSLRMWPQTHTVRFFSKIIFVTERWNARNNKEALKTTSADKDRQDYWKRLVSHLGKGSLCFQIPLWKISWPDCGLSGTGELITDSTAPRGCSAACGILRKKIIEKKNQGRKDWIGQVIGRAQIHIHLQVLLGCDRGDTSIVFR